MAIYNPPTQNVPTFNPIYWDNGDASSDYLTTAQADATFAKLSGNQTIIGFETFAGGVKTETLQSITLGSDINVSENINLASSKSLEIDNVSVLSSTTLGSSVVNSSLTSLGTLSAGVNIASGQTYKINNVFTLSSTTLGSSVVNSSLTSLGTQSSGVNIASGQTYKVNNVAVLSSTTLGSSVVTSSLTSIGTTVTSTLYYLQGTTLASTTASRVATKLSNDAGASSIVFEKYSFSLPSGTTQFTLPFTYTTAFVKISVRTNTRSYLVVGDAYTNGLTVAPAFVASYRIAWSVPTTQISSINSVNTPAMTIPFASALGATTTFFVSAYYFTE